LLRLPTKRQRPPCTFDHDTVALYIHEDGF
jgi:hypothetical protein